MSQGTIDDRLAEESYLVVIGRDGILDRLGVNTIEAYKQEDLERRSRNEPGLLSPILEREISMLPIQFTVDALSNLTDSVAEIYQRVCEAGEQRKEGGHVAGKFNDSIQVFRTGEDSYQMMISQCAFPKPALATDMAVVIKGLDENHNDRYMLVTGVRKAPPGEGMPAWLGGFVVLAKGDDGIEVLDSFGYTGLKETLEEAGLKLQHADAKALQRDYEPTDKPIKAYLGKESHQKEYDAIMVNLGTIETSNASFKDGGERYPDGTKRVHLTNGFATLIDVGNQYVDEAVMETWLTPGDDIGKLKFFDITREVTGRNPYDLSAKLQFGIQHHNDFIVPTLEAANAYFISGHKL